MQSGKTSIARNYCIQLVEGMVLHPLWSYHHQKWTQSRANLILGLSHVSFFFNVSLETLKKHGKA